MLGVFKSIKDFMFILGKRECNNCCDKYRYISFCNLPQKLKDSIIEIENMIPGIFKSVIDDEEISEYLKDPIFRERMNSITLLDYPNNQKERILFIKTIENDYYIIFPVTEDFIIGTDEEYDDYAEKGMHLFTTKLKMGINKSLSTKDCSIMIFRSLNNQNCRLKVSLSPEISKEFWNELFE